MKIETLVIMAKQKGIRDFGLTDHIHTPYNLPDIASSRREFEAVNPSPNFHFGVEVSVVSQWEVDEIRTGKYKNLTYGIRDGGPADAELTIGLTAENIETYNIEYVVGGAHWPIYDPIERESIIRSFHRQNMFLTTHPLINIVAHPWWKKGKDWIDPDGVYRGAPWFDDFSRIPKSMHNEFADAAISNNKIVEINIDSIILASYYTEKFKRQYLDYIAFLKEKGTILTIGSDCHDEYYEVDFEKAALMLDSVGITDACLWRLDPRQE